MQQLLSKHIRIGLAGHILTSKPASGRTPAFRTRLARYVEQGFAVIECHINVPMLPSDDTLRTLFQVPQLEVLWCVGIEDIASGLRFFERAEWAAFISKLAEERLKGVRHSIVLGIDRSIRYAAKDVAPLLAVSTNIAELIPCIFEFENGTWKKAESLFVTSKVPRFELDAPHLPALIKPMTGEERKRSYLKLVGRNAKDWLAHDVEERYCHTYTEHELREVASRVIELSSRSEEVVVIVGNYPAEAAYHNALSLANILGSASTETLTRTAVRVV